MNPNTQLTAQGTTPAGEAFSHVVLKTIENDVTNILQTVGTRTFWHRLLATGEIISTELSLPVIRELLVAADSFVAQ